LFLETRTTTQGKWNELTKLEFENWIVEAFNSDIAYFPSEIMPKDKSIKFKDLLLSFVTNQDCRYYTNWFNQLSSNNVWSWNSITKILLICHL
jgi:hypothetical protein